ncbi:MAG: hypothetical protein WC464_08515 [Bdellovibrionales bacterium]
MKKTGYLFVLLAVAACGGSDKPKVAETVPEPEIRTENLICPQVAIIKQAEEEFDYGGEKPDAAQLVAKARLKKIEGDCAYRNREEKSGIDIAFKLNAAAARGPRLGGDQVSFPYFIAVVDPSDAVLSRQIVTAQFKFEGDKKVAEITEPLHVFIPMKPKELLVGPSYRVLIGFTKSAH